MAKSKTQDTTKVGKDAQVKAISSVKQGAVTKPSQSSKAKSKEIAKQAVNKADKASKSENKSKKVAKEPTPDPSSESESDAETSSGTSSSDSDSDAAPKQSKAKLNGAGKINGAAKPNPKLAADTSDSSDSSEDEAGAAVPVSAPVTAVKADAGSEDSEEDSEDESDEEDDTVPGAVNAKVLNGKLEEIAASKEVSSDNDSESGDSESGDSEDGSGSDSDSSEDKSEEEKAPLKKRKANETAAPVAKKAKTEIAPANGDPEAVSNLYVGGISWNVDEEWLANEFGKFGEVKSARLIMDRNTQKPKGFGYVDYANVEDAVKAQQEMHGVELDGRILKVDFSKPKTDYGTTPSKDRAKTYGDAPSAPSSTLFCANLSFDATEDTVGEEFGKHGNVLGVRLPTDMDSGMMKGFGYVEFATAEEASRVKDAMTGASIAGRAIRLDFSTPRSGGGDRGGGRGGGRGRGGFDRGGRGGGRGRGGFDRGRGGFDRGGRGGSRGGRGGSTNRGGFGDFQGKKIAF